MKATKTNAIKPITSFGNFIIPEMLTVPFVKPISKLNADIISIKEKTIKNMSSYSSK
jgi:hypothetical protein